MECSLKNFLIFLIIYLIFKIKILIINVINLLKDVEHRIRGSDNIFCGCIQSGIAVHYILKMKTSSIAFGNLLIFLPQAFFLQ